MKRQYVITHTIRPAEFPALLDGCVTNTPSVKMLFPQKKKTCSIIFLKTPRLWFGLLRNRQVFLSPVKLYIGGLLLSNFT